MAVTTMAAKSSPAASLSASSLKKKAAADAWKVIPLAPIDQGASIRILRTRTYFVAEGMVLDEARLRGALDDLIRNHWPKLGARMTEGRDSGKTMAYHLPADGFADDYPLFRWSSKKVSVKLAELKGMPKATPPEAGVTLHDPVTTFEENLGLPMPLDEWRYLEGWLGQKPSADDDAAALMWVHLTKCEDATIVCISVPHAFLDQLGLAALVRAWTGLLEGKTPPAMVGFEGDAVCGDDYDSSTYGMEELSHSRKGKIRVWRGRWERALQMPTFVYELTVQPKEDAHLIFLPLPLIRTVRERLNAALVAAHEDHNDVTESDVVGAILTKFSKFHRTGDRKVAYSNAINLRGRVANLPADKCDGFLHNAVGAATTRMSINRNTPLADLARASRRSNLEASDPQDAKIQAAVLREKAAKFQSMHVVEAFEHSYSVTSWTAAWRGVSFAAAATDESPSAERAPEKRIMVLGQSNGKKTPMRYMCYVLCKTEEGFWATFTAGTGNMKRIREYLATDPLLENL